LEPQHVMCCGSFLFAILIVDILKSNLGGIMSPETHSGSREHRLLHIAVGILVLIVISLVTVWLFSI